MGDPACLLRERSILCRGFRHLERGAEASALKPAAAELAALAPDVIACRATPATTALKAATTKIPIIFKVVVDPALKLQGKKDTGNGTRQAQALNTSSPK
jgi:ABC-type uncharacterized transport system substrate-binding protein